jgi:TonB-linked SusC/RagA family outer membrane protein
MDPETGKPALDWGVPSQMGTRPYAGNSNLLGSLDLDDRPLKRFNGNASAYMEVKFLKHFSLRSTLGVTLLDDYETTYQNSQFGDAQNVQGRSTKENDRRITLTLNEVLSYNRTFGDHNIRVLIGHENYKYKRNDLSLTRTGFKFPDQTELDNAAVTESVGGSFEDNHTIESYFGGVNYAYNDKYLASASYRRDGSSRFATDVRWGNFYAAGIGWRISQEPFLQSVPWLNELKLKVSYGELGNDDIGLFYQYGNYYYADGTGGYAPVTGRPANPDLKWEGNKTLNAGFDFSIFSYRLQGTIEYFDRTSNDLLFDVPPALSTGGLNVFMNIGVMTNKGIDVSLGYNAIRKKDFDWRIDLNVTHFTNKITTLPPKQRENGIIQGTKKLLEGRSLFDFWLREFAGVDASTGDALYYRDVLGTDGKPTGERVLTNNITMASFYYRGSAIPDVAGGLTNSFRYKNFDLSILTTFAYGGKFYDGNYQTLMTSGLYGQHWHSDIKQRWQKPGDVTNIPRLQNAIVNQDGNSDKYLFDGSYLNIKNITLTYTFSKTLVNRLHLAGLQIFGNVDNAFLLTVKKGMDPQRNFGSTADATYPPFRIISAGINVNLQ